jgi:UDP-N-acetylmuramoylalanine--D-glutamate ligase
MQSYARAKARIFQGGGAQILNRDDGWSLGMRLPGRRLATFGLNSPQTAGDWGIASGMSGPFLTQGDRRVMALAELGVPGLHNAANALAALALCTTLGLPESPMVGALRRFRGLPHRLQPVAACRGITFFDDSKGTNVGATVAALSGLGRNCVLIAGGEGKGQDFAPLAQAVSQHARAVVLIGRDRERIREALETSGVALLAANTLEDAVSIAYAAAMPGDAVLLSPACASFDMFRDYRHRGEEFARIAQGLAQRSGGRH